ncbi:MAG: hypothetical protein U0946_03440 [Patescibacteria group bacterium]|nr:hypothetical protein [Patescibacteria group bacterium]
MSEVGVDSISIAPEEREAFINNEALRGLHPDDREKMVEWLGVGTAAEAGDGLQNLLLTGLGEHNQNIQTGIPRVSGLITARLYQAYGWRTEPGVRKQIFDRIKEKLGEDEFIKFNRSGFVKKDGVWRLKDDVVETELPLMHELVDEAVKDWQKEIGQDENCLGVVKGDFEENKAKIKIWHEEAKEDGVIEVSGKLSNLTMGMGREKVLLTELFTLEWESPTDVICSLLEIKRNTDIQGLEGFKRNLLEFANENEWPISEQQIDSYLKHLSEDTSWLPSGDLLKVGIRPLKTIEDFTELVDAGYQGKMMHSTDGERSWVRKGPHQQFVVFLDQYLKDNRDKLSENQQETINKYIGYVTSADFQKKEWVEKEDVEKALGVLEVLDQDVTGRRNQLEQWMSQDRGFEEMGQLPFKEEEKKEAPEVPREDYDSERQILKRNDFPEAPHFRDFYLGLKNKADFRGDGLWLKEVANMGTVLEIEGKKIPLSRILFQMKEAHLDFQRFIIMNAQLAANKDEEIFKNTYQFWVDLAQENEWTESTHGLLSADEAWGKLEKAGEQKPEEEEEPGDWFDEFRKGRRQETAVKEELQEDLTPFDRVW